MIVTAESILETIEGCSITERGLQTSIGISEVGMACQRCVIRKLAEVPKTQMVGSWRAQLGTYVHAGLETDLSQKFASEDAIFEQRLLVHEYKSLSLAGSCDAFFPNEGAGFVVDWKVVGDDTLDLVRKGKIKQQYVVQGHLYGLGWHQLGYSVSQVGIMFLPANKGNLSRDAVPHVFDWDVQVAASALAKLEAYIDSAEDIGWEELMRQHAPLGGCLSCSSYQAADNPVRDLLLR